jgi:hypothetical protein
MQGGGGADRNDGGSDARDEERANVRDSFRSMDETIISLIRPRSSGKP